jgi:hypothetical protein
MAKVGHSQGGIDDARADGLGRTMNPSSLLTDYVTHDLHSGARVHQVNSYVNMIFSILFTTFVVNSQQSCTFL